MKQALAHKNSKIARILLILMTRTACASVNFYNLKHVMWREKCDTYMYQGTYSLLKPVS